MKPMSVALVALVVVMAGCAKPTPEHLRVMASYEAEDPIFGKNTEVGLYSETYDLAYRGEFSECSIQDPITKKPVIYAIMRRSECPLLPEGAVVEVTYMKHWFEEDKKPFVVCTFTNGKRTVKVAYDIYPVVGSYAPAAVSP